jgi:ABC-2 type transport system ATP-binding protein
VYYGSVKETPVVVENVSKRFGSIVALDSVSWAPNYGQVTALVGLNGAGKSTLMRVMTGLVRANSGVVTVKSAAGRRPLSAMIEAPALFTGLSTRRNLQLHRILADARPGEVAEVAELAQNTNVLGRRVGALSQGYRQRVAIAVALLGRPDMLMLDEPANALDPEAVVHLRHLIRRVADGGTAVVVSSHLLRELEGTADSLTVLHEGKVLYDGPTASFAGSDRLFARVADADAGVKLVELLHEVGVAAELVDDGISTPVAGNADGLARQVFATASTASIDLVELRHITQTLEEAFHAAIAGARS